MPLSMLRPYARLMAVSTTPRRPRAKDLRGIRQRGQSYQVRVFGGIHPLTGKDV